VAAPLRPAHFLTYLGDLGESIAYRATIAVHCGAHSRFVLRTVRACTGYTIAHVYAQWRIPGPAGENKGGCYRRALDVVVPVWVNTTTFAPSGSSAKKYLAYYRGALQYPEYPMSRTVPRVPDEPHSTQSTPELPCRLLRCAACNSACATPVQRALPVLRVRTCAGGWEYYE
jgi:hypothetical protein